MYKFIYCFEKQDKNELIKKGYKFLMEKIIDEKKIYVFLYDDKLNFTFDKKKFVLTNKMQY